MAAEYNPSAYLKDFSWIGRAGDRFAKVAEKFPALMQLNKDIREDRMMKEKSQTTFINYIKDFSDADILDLANSMGLNAKTAEEAKKKMINTIPSFTDKTDNKQYALDLANKFINPMLDAGKKYDDAQSVQDPNATDVTPYEKRFTPTKLLAPFYGTELGSAATQTPFMQEEQALSFDDRKTTQRLGTEDTFAQKKEDRVKTSQEEQDRVEYERAKKLRVSLGLDDPQTDLTVAETFRLVDAIEDRKTRENIYNSAKSKYNDKLLDLANKDVDTTIESIKNIDTDMAGLEEKIATLQDKQKANKKEDITTRINLYTKRLAEKAAEKQAATQKLRELKSLGGYPGARASSAIEQNTFADALSKTQGATKQLEETGGLTEDTNNAIKMYMEYVDDVKSPGIKIKVDKLGDKKEELMKMMARGGVKDQTVIFELLKQANEAIDKGHTYDEVLANFSEKFGAAPDVLDVKRKQELVNEYNRLKQEKITLLNKKNRTTRQEGEAWGGYAGDLSDWMTKRGYVKADERLPEIDTRMSEIEKILGDTLGK